MGVLLIDVINHASSHHVGCYEFSCLCHFLAVVFFSPFHVYGIDLVCVGLIDKPGEIHLAKEINNWCDREIVFATESKVVSIMRGCYFHDSSAKLHIHFFVRDDLHFDWS